MLIKYFSELTDDQKLLVKIYEKIPSIGEILDGKPFQLFIKKKRTVTFETTKLLAEKMQSDLDFLVKVNVMGIERLFISDKSRKRVKTYFVRHSWLIRYDDRNKIIKNIRMKAAKEKGTYPKRTIGENAIKKHVNQFVLITKLIEKVILKHPKKCAEYKSGKTGLVGLFVGDVLKLSKGRADAKLTNELVISRLNRLTNKECGIHHEKAPKKDVIEWTTIPAKAKAPKASKRSSGDIVHKGNGKISQAGFRLGKTIATVNTGLGKEYDEGIANANFMVKSWNNHDALVEALGNMLKLFPYAKADHPDEDAQDAAIKRGAKLLAQIRKAK